ncbi:MAG: hypothetical protein V4459_13935 [Pseudomonadota bacterium]
MSSVPLPHFITLAALALAVPLTPPASAAPATDAVAPAPAYRYADIVDLAIKAPMVIDATVRSAVRIKGAEAAAVPPGLARFYVTVDVVALIRGADAVPPRLSYVVDIPLDSQGNVARLKKQRVLLFARPIATAADQIQLVAANAQLLWSPTTEAVTRRIAADVAAPDAPPAITGISNAFHSPGTLPGEGETQIFLTTSGGPVSLSISRKQGNAAVWTVALSEVVEDSLPPPAHDSFLWYRLACGLPPAIPGDLLAGLDPRDSASVTEDYALVLKDLGPCRR